MDTKSKVDPFNDFIKSIDEKIKAYDALLNNRVEGTSCIYPLANGRTAVTFFTDDPRADAFTQLMKAGRLFNVSVIFEPIPVESKPVEPKPDVSKKPLIPPTNCNIEYHFLKNGCTISFKSNEKSMIKIGAEPKADFVLNKGLGVARMHAVIEILADKSLQLIDMGGDSGTYLNDSRVVKAPLIPGNVITIGSDTIEYTGWTEV